MNEQQRKEQVEQREKWFGEQIVEAKKRVESLDKIDGFKDRNFSTILFALKSGLLRPQNGSQFEAYVMLEELTRQFYERTKHLK